MTILDVMTANRNERIWARAQGTDIAVSDSNVPKTVPVVSNVGGGSKRSSAIKEGVLHYKSGQDAIEHLALRKGFKSGLFADERSSSTSS